MSSLKNIKEWGIHTGNMKGLKALEKLQEIVSEEFNIDIAYGPEYELFCEIGKNLIALEIIIKHKLLNYVLKNPKCAKMYNLSNIDIDILKEVLK